MLKFMKKVTELEILKEKSCIRETEHLSTDADTITANDLLIQKCFFNAKKMLKMQN